MHGPFFHWRRTASEDWDGSRDAMEVLKAAYAARDALPAEERGVLNYIRSGGRGYFNYSDDNAVYDRRSARYRAAQTAVVRAYRAYLKVPKPVFHLEEHQMLIVGRLMAEFGMTFPDLPHPPIPQLSDYGITQEVFAVAMDSRIAKFRVPPPGPEDRDRLLEFGRARAKVAAWHDKADVPGIPEHKLQVDAEMKATSNGWIILDNECRAAFRIWRSLADSTDGPSVLQRMAAELDLDLWTGWINHLDTAASHDGLTVNRTIGRSIDRFANL